MLFGTELLSDHGATFLYVISVTMVFCETGLFFGMVFPGDTLLFTLGMWASSGRLDVWFVSISLLIASILGYQFAYWQGAHIARWAGKRPDGFFFTQKRIQKADRFFKKYGVFSVLIAKNIAIVRVFVPYIAGMVKMKKLPYFIYNVLGSLIWVPVFVLLGYFFGASNPDLVEIAVPWIAGAILLFIVVTLIQYLRFRLRK